MALSWQKALPQFSQFPSDNQGWDFFSLSFLARRGGGKKNNCSTAGGGHHLQADVRSAHADLDVPTDSLIHAADTAERWVGFLDGGKKKSSWWRINRFKI